MDNWQLWLVLAAMLSVGSLFRVGCFLGQFAAASLVTSLLAPVVVTDLDVQLQVFLFWSLLLIGASYLRRKVSHQG